ncbi:hypothetical protein GCM10020000_87040 [Streptomyces olivoverticillatus]
MNAATRGQAVINHYQQSSSPEDLATTTADLVADLILWSAHRDLDWDDTLRRAEGHAAEESCCNACEARNNQQPGGELAPRTAS